MPKLNQPYRTPGKSKKMAVKVRNPKTGNTNTVRIGDPKRRIKKSNTERKKRFLARHQCATQGPKTQAR